MEEAVSGDQKRPDKKGVFGEVFSEIQLRAFFDTEPVGNNNKDFAILLRAYRSLPVEAFEDFIPLFIEGGFNLKALNAKNETFLDYIKPNQSQQSYVVILERHLAALA